MIYKNLLKPGIYFMLFITLVACGGSDERVEFNTIQDIVIVKKMLIEPFTGYEITENKLHLIGPTKGNIPNGFWEVVNEGECDFGRFALIYQKETKGDNLFDYKFGFRDLYHIEIIKPNEKMQIYNLENNQDSVRIIYDHISKVTKDKKNVVISLHYNIGILCFNRLEGREHQAGISVHLSQQLGGSNARALEYPYIRLSPSLFSDMKKRGLLNKNDRFYVSSLGSVKGYKYKRLDDIQY